MKVTKIDLRTPPPNLLRAIEDAEITITRGTKGQLTIDQLAQAIYESEFLPPDTEIFIERYLDSDKKAVPAPRRYNLLPEREKSELSSCGDKLYQGYTQTCFTYKRLKSRSAVCATIAHLWMPNATFHAHGNEEGKTNEGHTFEDYEVVGGGAAWYVMDNEVFYVEPDKDPEAGIVGWEIPPGMLHGVFSENPDNPALAVLRFHRQGLALRTEGEKPGGWGFPRDEKVYNFASRAIRSMIDVAQDRDPTYKLPNPFIQFLRRSLGQGVLGTIT